MEIHPNAQPVFNEQGRALLELMDSWSRTESVPASKEGQPVLYPAATLDRSDIHNFSQVGVGHGGIRLSKRLLVGELFHGFEEEGYKALRLLAEKIQRLKSVREEVSTKAMEEAVFEWAVDSRLGRTDQTLCERISEEFNGRVRERWVWVAAFGLYTDFDFPLGRTEIHPFRAAFFETWEASLIKRGYAPEQAKAVAGRVRSTLQGSAACTMRIKAEPTRAQEIAMEEAEIALSILRVFLPSSMHPLVPSYCRPLGREELDFSACLIIENDEVMSYSEADHGDVRPWTLDQEMLELMNDAGLGALHHLYLRDKKTEFQTDLLRSVFTYSRSSLQKDPSDRLVYVFRALDSFLLQNKSENIQQNIADRIAFTISSDPEERRRIVETVKKAYALRSDVVHHDRGVEEMDLMTEFLKIVYRFYLMLIGNHRQYPTRKDFFDEVESKKYT